MADQNARAVLIFDREGQFLGPLRLEKHDAPAWAVCWDGDRHFYVGTGPVVDVLWAPDLKRLYYIDFETAAVRYNPVHVPCL